MKSDRAPLKRSFFEAKMKLVSQAMEEAEIDMWLTFTRENNEDPMAEDLGMKALTWRSAGIIDSSGDRTAVVGNLDTDTVKQRGLYHKVFGYGKEGASPKLREIVTARNPRKIAVNTSYDFGFADGLSLGMKDYLQRCLKGYSERFVSSEELVTVFRAKLVPGELDLIKKSIQKCEEIYDMAARELIRPGRRDEQIHEAMKEQVRRMGLEPAWDEGHCPAVTIGKTPAGHTGFHGDVAKKGDLVHIDFGVRYEGYCSDIQRMYLLGSTVPASVRDMFDVARKATDAGIERLRPGVKGYHVDKACRDVVIGAGYPEFMHATGHVLGRATHEIGPLLGPRWPERYGKSSEKEISEGMVFAVEPSVEGELGTCNLEQDLLVTSAGARPLSKPQEEIIVI